MILPEVPAGDEESGGKDEENAIEVDEDREDALEGELAQLLRAEDIEAGC